MKCCEYHGVIYEFLSKKYCINTIPNNNHHISTSTLIYEGKSKIRFTSQF